MVLKNLFTKRKAKLNLKTTTQDQTKDPRKQNEPYRRAGNDCKQAEPGQASRGGGRGVTGEEGRSASVPGGGGRSGGSESVADGRGGISVAVAPYSGNGPLAD